MNKMQKQWQSPCAMVLLVMTVLAGPMANANAQDDLVIASGDLIDQQVIISDEQRAKVLLGKAVDHLQKNGVDFVGDFNQSAAFIDNELYVFALRVDGRFLASGGSSLVLAGDSVLDTPDVFGKPFFRDMIEQAVKDGHGVVEYHWSSPTDGQGEPKRTFFKRVDDVIVAVGYYPSRATSFQARRFLDRAVKAMVTDEAAALKAFNQANGRFVKNDLYVFVLDMTKGTFIAHGAMPDLKGKSHEQVLSPDGQPVITTMLDNARQTGKGELAYLWTNPATGKAETKHTYYRVLDNKLVGVGYYQR